MRQRAERGEPSTATFKDERDETINLKFNVAILQLDILLFG